MVCRQGRAREERGIGRLTLIVFGTIGAIAAFCAYQIVPFYYYYFELLNQMEAVIRVAGIEDDRKIRGKLDYHIKKMQIPAEIDQLKIVREGNHMKLSLKYEEVFYITYRGKTYDLYVFPFLAQVEGNF